MFISVCNSINNSGVEQQAVAEVQVTVAPCTCGRRRFPMLPPSVRMDCRGVGKGIDADLCRRKEALCGLRRNGLCFFRREKIVQFQDDETIVAFVAVLAFVFFCADFCLMGAAVLALVDVDAHACLEKQEEGDP